MKKTIFRFFTLCCLAVSLIALQSTESQAITEFSYRVTTGSACMKVGTAGKLRITIDDGAIYNDEAFGGETLIVECPVQTNGGNSGFLWYMDNSPSSMTCQFRVDDKLGTASESQMRLTSGDDSTYRILDFSAYGINDGFAHFRCWIPPRDAEGNPTYIIGYGAKSK